MRQRKPPIRRKTSAFAELNKNKVKNPEEIFCNAKGREWLKRQVNLLGRGKHLLKKWSVRTPAVKQQAFKLSQGKPALNAVRAIAKFTSSQIKFVEVGNITATKFYGRQNADDLITTRKMPTFKGSKTGIIGCQSFAAVMMALLRAAKPASGKISEVKAVRTVSPRIGKQGKIIGMPHTIVSFKINGEKYLADPFKSGYSFFGSEMVGMKGRMVTKATDVERTVKELKKQGLWKEALDPYDFGIHSFKDYVEETRRHGSELALFADLDKIQRDVEKLKN